MSDVEISKKKQTDSNNQKPDGKSVTESLTGILKEDDLDARKEGMPMATRGRKPKPTAMKELEGNPGKHPMNTSEPKPNKKAPACPKWLEPEAKKEWRRLQHLHR